MRANSGRLRGCPVFRFILLSALLGLTATPARAGSVTINQPAQSTTTYTVGMAPPNSYLTGNLSLTVPSSGVGFGYASVTASSLGFDGTGQYLGCCDSQGNPQVFKFSEYYGSSDFSLTEDYPYTATGTFDNCDPVLCFWNYTGSPKPIKLTVENFSVPNAPPVVVTLNWTINPYVPPKTDGNPCKPCPCPNGKAGPSGGSSCGDPINIGTGNVFEEVTDYQTTGQNPLAFRRYYNSAGGGFAFASTLGPNWRTPYDRYIQIPSTYRIAAERPDGQIVAFTLNSGVWTPDSDVDVRLSQTGSTWTLIDTDDTVETYHDLGTGVALLTSITARNGYTQTLTYDSSNHLTSVTDSYNRSLSFTHQNGLLNTITTPDGLVLSYAYNSNGNLSSITYSTSPQTSQTYLYENSDFPNALTGIIDENGNRFATWSYDGSGRAISNQHAGGAELMQIAYNDNTGNRTVTNALGEQEVYKFTTLQGVPKLIEVDRLASSTTTAATRYFTYDSNGYRASETDWNGNRTTYVNDAHGQPTTVTEAVGTPQQRVTQTTYHATLHLPVQIVTPGLTTNFTYDANGNLLSQTQTDTTTNTLPYSTNGQTRSWSYAWANALPVSVTDPRGKTTQFAYDASGALIQTVNALGQVTKTTQHTAGGLPQTVVDPSGVVTNLAYDARQRLVSRTVNTAAGPLTTNSSYDAAGNLTQVTQPDGSALANTYDAAHRLVATADLFAEYIQYALDAIGDRLQTSVLNSASAVVRQNSAHFDALGRRLQDVGGVGQTTTYAYDANGNRTTMTDPLGRVTRQGFDALNRRTQVKDAANGVTNIAYDAHDRPVSVTNPTGNAGIM
jgi:YD repeat-containing protein